MKFTEIISEAGSPAQQAAIAIAMKKAGKKPKNEGYAMEDEQIDGMAQGEIREIIKNAVHIKNQLDNGVSLDGWMYSFVTVSNDKLNSVAEQINNPNIDEQGMYEGLNKECPPATQNIELNLKNRQKAINEYGYGPLNPDMPNTKFWMKKVDEWNLDSVEEAKQSLCGNCAAFDQRTDTLDCIAQGIDSDQGAEDPTIEAGDLGYCRFLKFKCASRRTCDAWVTGGPLTDDKPKVDEGENWSKHNNKRVGGMSKKSVSSYRRSHPGSKIQTAVTTKPSKLKKGSKAAARRKSFCARMKGMKKHRTGAKTAHDPNSNINKSLRRWHCESIEELQELVMIAEQFIRNKKNEL
jgi:hypothetical protein